MKQAQPMISKETFDQIRLNPAERAQAIAQMRQADAMVSFVFAFGATLAGAGAKLARLLRTSAGLPQPQLRR